MGGRGGSLGGSQGTARVTARAAAPAAAVPAARYDVSTLARMSDRQLSSTLDDIFSNTPVDDNQQNTDTQRFFNAIGWSDRKPQVLGESAYETARSAARAKSWYHTDDVSPRHGVSDASTYSKQYMGAGRQFLSGGIHGDGTYWADTSMDSWFYGSHPRATQIKGFFNTKTRSISERSLDTQIAQWRHAHPRAYQKIVNSQGGYGSGLDGTRSVFAAMFGYNVIEYASSGYRTVLDRSATTVSSTYKYRAGTNTQRNW